MVAEEGFNAKDIKELEASLAAKSEEVQRIRIEKNEITAAQEALKAEVMCRSLSLSLSILMSLLLTLHSAAFPSRGREEEARARRAGPLCTEGRA